MFWVHRILTQSIAITWVTRFTWALHPSPDVVTDGLDPWKLAFLRNYWHRIQNPCLLGREIIIALWFNEDKAKKKFWTKVMFLQLMLFFISLLRWGLSPPYHWDSTCQIKSPDSTDSQLTRRYQCTVCSQFVIHGGLKYLHCTIFSVLHVPGTSRSHILLLNTAFATS